MYAKVVELAPISIISNGFFNTTSSSSSLNLKINPNKVETNLDSEPKWSCQLKFK
jgi:hypothetical protein